MQTCKRTNAIKSLYKTSYILKVNSNLAGRETSIQNFCTVCQAEASSGVCCGHQDVSCSFSFPRQTLSRNETYKSNKNKIYMQWGTSNLNWIQDQHQLSKLRRGTSITPKAPSTLVDYNQKGMNLNLSIAMKLRENRQENLQIQSERDEFCMKSDGNWICSTKIGETQHDLIQSNIIKLVKK